MFKEGDKVKVNRISFDDEAWRRVGYTSTFERFANDGNIYEIKELNQYWAILDYGSKFAFPIKSLEIYYNKEDRLNLINKIKL